MYLLWDLSNPTLVRIRKSVGLAIVRLIRKGKCVVRLCRIEIIPDNTGVGLGRLLCAYLYIYGILCLYINPAD